MATTKPGMNDTFDERDTYKNLRLSVMSEEQQKLATKIQGWFRESYLDKDNRGVFQKMEMAELYWEGEANPPESDDDPASNTNIVNSTIEGQVAYLVEQNISVEAKARKPSSLPFRNQAVDLLEWCKDQNKLRRKMDVHERRRKKFGVGYLRVLWDPDALDSMGIPCIEPVNPAYLYPDPVVTDIYKIQQGRFFIEIINRSIDSAREKWGDELADAIEPGYVPMEYADTFDEFGEEPGEIAMGHYLHFLAWTHVCLDYGDDKEEPEGGEDPADGSDPSEESSSEYGGKKTILRLIEMSACGVIFRDTLEDDVVICDNDQRYPYFATPDMYREGSVWPKSTAELLIPVQDKINDIDDQIMINGRLTGNPQRLVDIMSSIDPDKVDNAGGTIYPSSYEGGMKYLVPPDMPQYIIQHRDKALSYERVVVSRWSDQMNGVKQTGVDTATESLGLQQAGTQNITHDQMLLEETLSEVFEYALVLMMENYKEDEIFNITGEMGEEDFMQLNPSKLLNIPQLIPTNDIYKQSFMRDFPKAEKVPKWMPHPEGLTEKIALNIKVTVGAGLPSNKAFIYQMLKDDPDITPLERRKLKREYVGLPIAEEPPMPPQAAPVASTVGQALQNPMVGGLTAGGAPMQPGGVLG